MNLDKNVELWSHYMKFMTFTSILRWLQVWWKAYL